MARTDLNGPKLAKWSKIIIKSFMVGGHWVGSVGCPETQVFFFWPYLEFLVQLFKALLA